MRGRTRTWLLGAATTLAIAVAGCGGGDDQQAKAPAVNGAATPTETIESGVLTVGSDIPFPPFEFREGSQLKGFDVDLTSELAKRLGLRVKWVDTSFDTLFTQVAAGRFDMAAAATTITPERAKQVSFTEPYYAAQQAFVVGDERSGDLAAVADLTDADVVAVQKGTTGEAWAREHTPAQIRSFPEAPDIYTALEARAVDAVIMDEPSAVEETAKRAGLSLAGTIDTQERYGFAIDPRNADLQSALNDALGEIEQDGTYERIYDRYESLPPAGSILGVTE